jgi:hypothetical protein
MWGGAKRSMKRAINRRIKEGLAGAGLPPPHVANIYPACTYELNGEMMFIS